jgi:hypothetical protein
LFSFEHIVEHHAVCLYGENKCPFQVTGNCFWKGLKSDLKEHVIAKHPHIFRETSVLHRLGIINRLMILFCYGNLFTFYRKWKDGRIYCAVQLIGTSSEASKYKCQFTLSAENGIEEISKTFLVRSYVENWETIFNSGKCLHLDELTLRTFFAQPNPTLSLTLSTVQ